MAESFRKAVGFAVEQINPKLSEDCPLSDFAHSIFNSDQENRTSIFDKFVMYSRAPPAMMYINHLLFYAGRMNSSQTPELDGVKFRKFLAPQFIDTTMLEMGRSIFDVSMYQDYLSHEKDGRVDDILRESLLKAAEKLKERFSSLSPSPVDLLLQSYSVQGDPQDYNKDKPLDEASIDAAFNNATEAALFELKKSDQGESSLQLMELLIGEASKFDSAVKMAVGERIVLSSVPNPDISAGDVISICLGDAVLRVKCDLGVKFPVETIIAAIERLPADKEVKLLLQFVVEIFKTPELTDFDDPRAITVGMKVKYKIPKGGSAEDERFRINKVPSGTAAMKVKFKVRKYGKDEPESSDAFVGGAIPMRVKFKVEPKSSDEVESQRIIEVPPTFDGKAPMRVKFKVQPESSNEVESQRIIEVSPTLFKRFVNMFTNTK